MKLNLFPTIIPISTVFSGMHTCPVSSHRHFCGPLIYTRTINENFLRKPHTMDHEENWNWKKRGFFNIFKPCLLYVTESVVFFDIYFFPLPKNSRIAILKPFFYDGRHFRLVEPGRKKIVIIVGFYCTYWT